MKKLTHYSPQASEIHSEVHTSRFVGKILDIIIRFVPYILVKNWLDDDRHSYNELKARILKAFDPSWKFVSRERLPRQSGGYWSLMYVNFFGKREIYNFDLNLVAHRIPKGDEYDLFCVPELSVRLSSLIRIVHEHCAFGGDIQARGICVNPDEFESNLIGVTTNPHGYLLTKIEKDHDKKVEILRGPASSSGLTVYLALLHCLHLRFQDIFDQVWYVCDANRFVYEDKSYIPIVIYREDMVMIKVHTAQEIIDDLDEPIQLRVMAWRDITEAR